MIIRWLIIMAPILLSIVGYTDEPIKEEKVKRAKAPFHVLFSNDTTNTLTCVSPYHKKGEPFREKTLRATVDETAGIGIEVHMLQPAHGWVPWWQSKVYSVEEHHRWWKDHYGVTPDMSVHNYLLKGGDVLGVFVKRCRKRGLSPFISLRLNDAHHLNHVNTPKNTRGIHAICRFYAEHPEYRLDPKTGSRAVQNWAIPEVRNYKFALISEICQNYDIDGFELDFMRHPQFFNLDETTSEERVQIMTGFVGQVRELLNQTAQPGQHRWLCARIPAYLSEYDALGINLPTFIDAGVDMLNLSTFYFTEQQTDLTAIRKLTPDAAVYLEITHTTATGTRLTKSGGDNSMFRRTTDEQFFTAAHLAIARGADGISAFNFVYYREHGTPGRGPFNEPPFHIFKHLGDARWLARQPQHYFLSSRSYVNRHLPKQFEPGKTVPFSIDMAPPVDGWNMDGRLRIQSRDSLGNSQWRARFNGVDLNPTDDVSEPYPNPYPPMLGEPEELRAWTVPVGLLRDGINSIEISLVEGKLSEIVFLDVAVE